MSDTETSSEDASGDIAADIDPDVVLDYWGNVFEPKVELWFQIIVIVLNWFAFAFNQITSFVTIRLIDKGLGEV